MIAACCFPRRNSPLKHISTLNAMLTFCKVRVTEPTAVLVSFDNSHDLWTFVRTWSPSMLIKHQIHYHSTASRGLVIFIPSARWHPWRIILDIVEDTTSHERVTPLRPSDRPCAAIRILENGNPVALGSSFSDDSEEVPRRRMTGFNLWNTFQLCCFECFPG